MFGDNYSGFGHSVAISGNTMVVGAPFDAPGFEDFQGSVSVFARSGTAWDFIERLGANYDAGIDAEFGYSVAIGWIIGEDRIIVGIPVDGNSKGGSANVFTRIHYEL